MFHCDTIKMPDKCAKCTVIVTANGKCIHDSYCKANVNDEGWKKKQSPRPRTSILMEKLNCDATTYLTKVIPKRVASQLNRNGPLSDDRFMKELNKRWKKAVLDLNKRIIRMNLRLYEHNYKFLDYKYGNIGINYSETSDGLEITDIRFIDADESLRKICRFWDYSGNLTWGPVKERVRKVRALEPSMNRASPVTGQVLRLKAIACLRPITFSTNTIIYATQCSANIRTKRRPFATAKHATPSETNAIGSGTKKAEKIIA